jgi:hypothetical protein
MSTARSIADLFAAPAVRRGTTFVIVTAKGRAKQARVLSVEDLEVLSVPSRAITYAMLGRRDRVTAVYTAVEPVQAQA